MKGSPSSLMFMKLNNKQNKGFNQMMSILMLGLISAGGGVSVATFATEQQAGLTQTTGGAGLRESITIENVQMDPTIENGFENVVITLRNTGATDLDIGAIYINGTFVNLEGFRDADSAGSNLNLSSGEAGNVTLSTGGKLEAGSVQTFRVVTEGGGLVTTTATVSQN